MPKSFTGSGQKRIIKTFLSQKPAEDSFWTAAIFFALLFLCSYFYWMSDPEIARQWVARPISTFSQHQYWQLLTATFIHGDIKHFLANAPMLSVLIYLVYGYYGGRQLLIIIFGLGALTNYATILHHPPELGLLGISGVVYALCGYWVGLYLCIERKRPIAKRILRACGFAILVLLPTTFEPNTSYLAHFYGFLFGAIFSTYHFLKHINYFRSFEDFIWETDGPLLEEENSDTLISNLAGTNSRKNKPGLVDPSSVDPSSVDPSSEDSSENSSDNPPKDDPYYFQ